jgi:galactitol PTS system EIIA component
MEPLENLLVQSAILLNYPAEGVEDIITQLGGLLLAAGYVKESFITAALEREQTMPTGLPLAGDFNAAIPHTEVEHVLQPGVAFATLSKPVGFRNMVMPDEIVPVSLVFLLALDQPKAQIGMLQEIAGILQNPAIIENLFKASTSNEVLDVIMRRATN